VVANPQAARARRPLALPALWLSLSLRWSVYWYTCSLALATDPGQRLEGLVRVDPRDFTPSWRCPPRPSVPRALWHLAACRPCAPRALPRHAAPSPVRLTQQHRSPPNTRYTRYTSRVRVIASGFPSQTHQSRPRSGGEAYASPGSLMDSRRVSGVNWQSTQVPDMVRVTAPGGHTHDEAGQVVSVTGIAAA
jgi:hypothetical protein